MRVVHITLKVGRKERKVTVRKNGMRVDSLIEMVGHAVQRALREYPEGFK